GLRRRRQRPVSINLIRNGRSMQPLFTAGRSNAPNGTSALTTDLEILRWQHDAAEEMAANIVAGVGAYRDEYDAISIARLIGKLSALLRVHFAYEDSILYPRMF